ncbi:dipeptidyl aminopeptidase/acylaminoacyl peptidase [Phenylobacterium haematophilum]|uniref:Dipeptidyl aminopeptidase/acylaminoacyl peptidase n=1 Tax=Phenylobacterium haematophilum TaxID=98513 RepID=A0A840A770_9CAUL|nr:prolyl oligopeptidase family serine peptidase [Phenylobacterium haematophilum]MBB3893420.1 dipeptidyl aminopeptidase/acylaminoacyl peptidase [Phenylobacterium haematophilum]
MRLPSQIAALCLAAIAAPAGARSFTTDDLLLAEEFGQMAFTPDGPTLIFERQRPITEAGPFEYDTYPPLRRSRIYVARVGSSDPPQLLLKARDDEGHTAGPLSPDGKAMVVLRLKGRDWEAGVVQLASGKVRWLGVIPELAQLGQTIAWRSDRELVIAARATIPLRLRAGWQARDVLQAKWKATARGETALAQVSSAGAFSGERAGGGRLVLADVTSGKVSDLASGDFYDLQISPDGRQVAAMANLEALAPTAAPRAVASPNRRRNLVLVDLSSGAAVTPCGDCDLAPHLMAWSPDAREVLAYGRRPDWPQAALIRLGVAGVRQIATGDAALALGQTSEGHVIPYAGWLGATPIGYLEPAAGRRDWYALGDQPRNLTSALPAAPAPRLLANDGEAIFVTSAGQVWRVTLSQAAQIAEGAAPLAAPGLSLSSRERQNSAPVVGWFRIQRDGRPALISTRGETAPASNDPAPPIAMPGASASVVATDHGGLELQLSAPAPRTVMTLNSEFATIDFAPVTEIRATGPGGEPLFHYLLTPRRPRTSPPQLIVIPYPGLSAYPPPRPYGGGTGRFPVNAELMAAAGYAVLIPALPRSRQAEPGEGLADQILAAIDLAAAQAGGFDASRPILWGQSFGGYSALMAASQSRRFAAVVASAAPADLASVRGVFDPHGEVLPADGLSPYLLGWSELGQANLRASPWEAPGLYVRNSPLFQAGQIEAPVLLIHGDIDFVRLSQAQEMFTALARQAKDVTLITAFGEGHIVSSPGNVREVYRRAFLWLGARAGPRRDGP